MYLSLAFGGLFHRIFAGSIALVFLIPPGHQLNASERQPLPIHPTNQLNQKAFIAIGNKCPALSAALTSGHNSSLSDTVCPKYWGIDSELTALGSKLGLHRVLGVRS